MDLIEVRRRLAEAGLRELEDLIEALFDSAAKDPVRAAPGVFAGYDPVIGHLFFTGEDHSAQWFSICRALAAKKKFRMTAPGWPDLPLRREAIKVMVHDDGDDVRLNVTGLFAESLYMEGWCPEHPPFQPFVGGLLADARAPAKIRNDPRLRREFPPAQVKGMTSGWLGWRSPATLAQDRRNRKMIAEHEARARMGV